MGRAGCFKGRTQRLCSAVLSKRVGVQLPGWEVAGTAPQNLGLGGRRRELVQGLGKGSQEL